MFSFLNSLVLISFILISLFLHQSVCVHSIEDYGGISNDSSDQTSWTNTNAFVKTIYAANSSETDRVALIPENQTYYIFNVEVSQLFNVTIRIEGLLITNNNITAWPESSSAGKLASFFISESKNLTFEGTGTLDGQGYDWWWYTILTSIDNRPRLFYLTKSENILIQQLTFKNSPFWTVDLDDNKDVVVRKITVITNVTAQKKLLQQAGYLTKEGIPTFPLNTDGIDPKGINYLIEDCIIDNFDDAIAVKPSHQGSKYSSCSENMIIRNMVIYFSVGMAIGSVPPNTKVNCVRNITFDNVTMHTPIKAIYVKTNPGTQGSGMISDITYKNFVVNNSLWYPIWIGPQQQRQPGTEGTGCSFLYPIIPECPTQPLVPVSNILLSNITMTNGLTLPGVILCNESKPCENFTFVDVLNDGKWLVQDDYVCENVQGISTRSDPAPPCFKSSSSSPSSSSSSSSSSQGGENHQSHHNWSHNDDDDDDDDDDDHDGGHGNEYHHQGGNSYHHQQGGDSNNGHHHQGGDSSNHHKGGGYHHEEHEQGGESNGNNEGEQESSENQPEGGEGGGGVIQIN